MATVGHAEPLADTSALRALLGPSAVVFSEVGGMRSLNQKGVDIRRDAAVPAAAELDYRPLQALHVLLEHSTRLLPDMDEAAADIVGPLAEKLAERGVAIVSAAPDPTRRVLMDTSAATGLPLRLYVELPPGFGTWSATERWQWAVFCYCLDLLRQLQLEERLDAPLGKGCAVAPDADFGALLQTMPRCAAEALQLCSALLGMRPAGWKADWEVMPSSGHAKSAAQMYVGLLTPQSNRTFRATYAHCGADIVSALYETLVPFGIGTAMSFASFTLEARAAAKAAWDAASAAGGELSFAAREAAFERLPGVAKALKLRADSQANREGVIGDVTEPLAPGRLKCATHGCGKDATTAFVACALPACVTHAKAATMHSWAVMEAVSRGEQCMLCAAPVAPREDATGWARATLCGMCIGTFVDGGLKAAPAAARPYAERVDGLLEHQRDVLLTMLQRAPGSSALRAQRRDLAIDSLDQCVANHTAQVVLMGVANALSTAATRQSNAVMIALGAALEQELNASPACVEDVLWGESSTNLGICYAEFQRYCCMPEREPAHLMMMVALAADAAAGRQSLGSTAQARICVAVWQAALCAAASAGDCGVLRRALDASFAAGGAYVPPPPPQQLANAASAAAYAAFLAVCATAPAPASRRFDLPSSARDTDALTELRNQWAELEAGVAAAKPLHEVLTALLRTALVRKAVSTFGVVKLASTAAALLSCPAERLAVELRNAGEFGPGARNTLLESADKQVLGRPGGFLLHAAGSQPICDRDVARVVSAMVAQLWARARSAVAAVALRGAHAEGGAGERQRVAAAGDAATGGVCGFSKLGGARALRVWPWPRLVRGRARCAHQRAARRQAARRRACGAAGLEAAHVSEDPPHR